MVNFINKIIADAAYAGASDIHFEPYAGSYRIRVRQDGLLYEISKPPFSLANYFIARLKVMANLDIAEHRLPQDGRFSLSLPPHSAIDVRMSTCPTLHGEKVVLRLLNTQCKQLTIDELGMEPEQKQQFLTAIHRPQGMILVTGPTGSGKTVTLYSALALLNQLKVNISTIEDPIEIQLTGINQVAVNSKANLTFATALRSFLRQDPDIIMVGEMRDSETTTIAIRAAQTGHLVFSTLHTNSATEAIIRLINMGIPRYNILSTISLVVAQRLVRKLCCYCKKAISLPKAALLQLGFSAQQLGKITLFQAIGCQHCYDGYHGRTGIYEVLPLSNSLQQLLLTNTDLAKLTQHSRQQGFTSLRQAGLIKAAAGETTLEELGSVIGP